MAAGPQGEQDRLVEAAGGEHDTAERSAPRLGLPADAPALLPGGRNPQALWSFEQCHGRAA